MADSDKQVNVLVIGGGPAGSTAAAMLARNGFSVLLLEREIFPRYHIGESLLASCLPTLRLSGAFDAVAAAGFRPVAAEWTHQDQPDTVRTVSFDFLVDASGRTGVLARKHFDMRTPHEQFQNVAVWGYWTGARLLSGSPEGAINVTRRLVLAHPACGRPVERRTRHPQTPVRRTT
jgi:flavin-dependent dehydrogenase